MPELPDVEGFKRYLDAGALHKTIVKTTVHDRRLLRDISPRGLAAKLKDTQLTATRRHGKFLFASTGGGGALVLHFGMTGQLNWHKGDEDDDPDYTRVALACAGGYRLAIISRRMLGRVGFTDDIDAFIAEEDLGPDALDDALDADAFVERLAGRRGKIKPALMKQSTIAGVGNVYSDEALFQAGIDPLASTDALGEDTLRQLHRVLRRVLKTAARHGGDPAELPRNYLLPHRDEEQCPRCDGKLEKATVSGRSAVFCPNCQEKGRP